uniref:Uncharacterized protein n=1 Tax=Octopus bimaculoides TaxID=37653 RepID=A0A0L8ICQ7_OCTBM
MSSSACKFPCVGVSLQQEQDRKFVIFWDFLLCRLNLVQYKVLVLCTLMQEEQFHFKT